MDREEARGVPTCSKRRSPVAATRDYTGGLRREVSPDSIEGLKDRLAALKRTDKPGPVEPSPLTDEEVDAALLTLSEPVPSTSRSREQHDYFPHPSRKGKEPVDADLEAFTSEVPAVEQKNVDEPVKPSIDPAPVVSEAENCGTTVQMPDPSADFAVVDVNDDADLCRGGPQGVCLTGVRAVSRIFGLTKEHPPVKSGRDLLAPRPGQGSGKIKGALAATEDCSLPLDGVRLSPKERRSIARAAMGEVPNWLPFLDFMAPDSEIRLVPYGGERRLLSDRGVREERADFTCGQLPVRVANEKINVLVATLAVITAMALSCVARPPDMVGVSVLLSPLVVWCLFGCSAFGKAFFCHLTPLCAMGFWLGMALKEWDEVASDFGSVAPPWWVQVPVSLIICLYTLICAFSYLRLKYTVPRRVYFVPHLVSCLLTEYDVHRVSLSVFRETSWARMRRFGAFPLPDRDAVTLLAGSIVVAEGILESRSFFGQSAVCFERAALVVQ